VSHLETLRTLLRDELAPIHARLATIEEKLGLLPDLLFLYNSATAQGVVQPLRNANVHTRTRVSWCRPGALQAGHDHHDRSGIEGVDPVANAAAA
jgi:hypothetical protein